jgi:hypothetical protein
VNERLEEAWSQPRALQFNHDRIKSSAHSMNADAFNRLAINLEDSEKHWLWHDLDVGLVVAGFASTATEIMRRSQRRQKRQA